MSRAISAPAPSDVQARLQASVEALNAGRAEAAADLALQAGLIHPACRLAWHLLALCRERTGDLNGALFAFERALRLEPDDAEIANDLGRLAMQMGMAGEAEALFRRFVALRPQEPDGPNNLACALRDQLRYAEAIEVLRAALHRHPESALLWNTLGSVVAEDGQPAKAEVFFDEALRLHPRFAKARYNRSDVRLHQGDTAGALADCEAAIAVGEVTEAEATMMRFVRSLLLVASGRLEEGWDAYEARLEPRHADVTHFASDAPAWTPETPLEGARLLVFGEQGLGDEVLFANVLPDLLQAMGPEGKLLLALEPRLVPLFRRSFPQAEVGPAVTRRIEHRSVRAAPFARGREVDAWAPLGSFLRRFRRSVDAFPNRPAFLKADPARVAHWRGEVAALGPGLKAGLLWKSLKVASQRARFYSPFAGWAPVLATPGVRFVNLQYGESAAEVAYAREVMGVELWTPPGLDLKDDLDDLAALATALDLVLGPANATLNLAAACGTPTWFVCPPGAWPRLGTDRYPWYPHARAFGPARLDRWDEAFAAVAAALARTAAAAA